MEDERRMNVDDEFQRATLTLNKEFKQKDMAGSLWPDSTAEIMRKGTIQINGQPVYAAIVKSEHDGDEKFELMVSAGLLFRNLPEQKLSPNSPDISGKVTIAGSRYKFGGWAKETQEGRTFTSVGLEHPKDSGGDRRIESDEGF